MTTSMLNSVVKGVQVSSVERPRAKLRAYDRFEYKAGDVGSLKHALGLLLQRNQVTGVVAISCSRDVSIDRVVQLPPAEKWKIAGMVDYEMKQQIPFALGDCYANWCLLPGWKIEVGFIMDSVALISACKKETANPLLDVAREAGLNVQMLQPDNLALINFAHLIMPSLLGEGREGGDCIGCIDIGEEHSGIVIAGTRVPWSRFVPIGRKYLQGEVPRKEAEGSALGDFQSEITRSLGFFTHGQKYASIKKIIITGSGAKVPDLAQVLSEALKLPVEIFDKKSLLEASIVLPESPAPHFLEHLHEYPISIALAMMSIGQVYANTNLLPPVKKTLVEKLAFLCFWRKPVALCGWGIEIENGVVKAICIEEV